MREALRRFNSTALALYIAAVDATIWLAALPFELFCKRIASQPHEPVWILVMLLFANAALLGLIASAVLATAELVRRGVTRPVPVLLRRLASRQSKPSVR